MSATTTYRPGGTTGMQTLTIALGPWPVAGVSIGVMENGKGNSGVVMGHAGGVLAAGVGGAVTVLTGKRLPEIAQLDIVNGDAMEIAPDVLRLLKQESDVVITGVGDRGSCSAYTAYDHQARGAWCSDVLTTARFQSIAQTPVTDFGIPSGRTVGPSSSDWGN